MSGEEEAKVTAAVDESALSLLIQRRFRASPARLFQAFTDPQMVAQWLHPETMSSAFAEVDARPGGSYRIGMRNADGDVAIIAGTFTTVEPPNHLAFTWRWEHEPAMGDTQVTVKLRADGDGTWLHLSHQRFDTAERRDLHNQGWQSCLINLERVC